jgi:Antibiotic biosynthesis monooxygenase
VSISVLTHAGQTAFTRTPRPPHFAARVYRLDKFKVPAAAREEFLARVRASNEILCAIPGFVEDCLLEQLGASGDSRIVTIAIWQDEQAFSSAKSIVQDHYKKIGFNPIEIIERLGIEADMDAYTKLEL